MMGVIVTINRMGKLMWKRIGMRWNMYYNCKTVKSFSDFQEWTGVMKAAFKESLR
jgi:hypothetical protein